MRNITAVVVSLSVGFLVSACSSPERSAPSEIQKGSSQARRDMMGGGAVPNGGVVIVTNPGVPSAGGSGWLFVRYDRTSDEQFGTEWSVQSLLGTWSPFVPVAPANTDPTNGRTQRRIHPGMPIRFQRNPATPPGSAPSQTAAPIRQNSLTTVSVRYN